MKILRSNVLNYALPILAIIVLTVLLIVTLFRLSNIQHEMRSNYNANMVWVLYQAHTESLTLNNALLEHIADPQAVVDIPFRYNMLLSRINLLNAGPQLRALEHIDTNHEITQHVTAINDFSSLLNTHNIEPQQAQQVRNVLESFNLLLSGLSTKAMIAQWEDAGARIDLYRNAVLTIFSLMIAILLCSAFISVRLLLALKRTREAEHIKQREIILTKELENERKISSLYHSFGTMVSHQFRTPLAIIDANMQRLIRAGSRMDATEVARRAEKVRTATKRLAGLIDSILHADRLMEKLSVSTQSYSLSELTAQVINEQKSLTPNREIVFIDETENNANVECDPILTAQILSNFLSNAINYSYTNSVIKIRVYRNKNWVYCDVQDHGRGILETDMPHIFERYFRAWTSTDSIGTGIGLHIANELATLQKGELFVRSESGSGSTFTLRLPSSPSITAIMNK